MKTNLLSAKLQNFHRQNFKKLAAYLQLLPDDYTHFSMSQYCAIPSDNPSMMKEPKKYISPGELLDMLDYQNFDNPVSECGTVACALGHALFALNVVTPANKNYWKNLLDNWDELSEKIFGLSMCNPAMEWCFSWLWDKIDNTPKGASARINWFLKNGVPLNYKAQMHGREPLCYKVD